MQKNASAAAILAFTTGAGIVLGTNGVKLYGVAIGSVASTVTIKSGTATQIETIASVNMGVVPVLLTGTVSATSSGGSFAAFYEAQ